MGIKVKNIDLGQFILSKTDILKISHAYDIFRYRTGDLIDPCFQAYILYIWLIFTVNLGVVLGVPLKYCSCLRCLCMLLRLHNSGEITTAASQNGSVLISFPS
jgi:hypothetical protein